MWGENWGTVIWNAGATSLPLMSPLGWMFLTGALTGAAILHFRKSLSKVKALIALTGIVVLPLIAIGQALPGSFIFENGTPADADQVNANFQGILNEVGRWHLTLYGSDSAYNFDNSTPIPTEVTQAFCADEDGCRVTVAVLDQFTAPGESAPQPSWTAASHGELSLWINPTLNSQGNQRYYYEGDSGGATGGYADGDGSNRQIRTATGCEMIDGQRVGGILDDNEIGFSLIYRLTPDPTPHSTCMLTIFD